MEESKTLPLNILSDIEVSEVSIVDKGANKRKFLLFKADSSTQNNNNNPEEISMLETILKAVSDVKLENEPAIDEAVKKANLSEKTETLKTVLRVLKASELPKEFLADLLTLAGGTIPTVEVEKVVEKIVEVEKKAEKDLNKVDLEKLSTEHRAIVEKSLALAEEAQKKAASVEAELNKEKDARKLAEFVNVAKAEYKQLPSTPEKLGAVLKNAAAVLSDEDYTELTRLLKAGQEAIARSEDFKEKGSNFGGNSTDTAYGKIKKAAEEIQKNSATPMTLASAIAQASSENPELYNEYINEVN